MKHIIATMLLIMSTNVFANNFGLTHTRQYNYDMRNACDMDTHSYPDGTQC